ncbi:MAG: stage sporulation family protein [Paucimonas sp.]|nr:stage sporulation family protein [Paucimonas sp.]
MPNDTSPAVRYASATDVGRVRTHNEDATVISAGIGLAIVADGMGGYNAGEIASGIATALLKEALEQRFRRDPGLLALPPGRMKALLTEEIRHASASIHAAAMHDESCRGMGTTLVLALLRQHDMFIAHIGDSRAYLLRGGEMRQLTRDHTLLQQQIDAGLITSEQARAAKQKNLLTRGMGVDDDVDPEVHAHALQAGDLVLLCSDGLTDELPDPTIEAALLAHASEPEALCKELVALANASGGGDNISVLAALVPGQAPAYTARPGWRARLQRLFRSPADKASQ